MNGVASSDAGRDGRGREHNNSERPVSIDYVRDGAVAAHRRGLSGSLLSKLGLSRSSPEPPKAGPLPNEPLVVNATHDAEAAGRAAMAFNNSRRSSTTSLSPGVVATTRSRKGSLRKNILRKGSLQRMETILSPRIESRMSNSTDSTDGSSVISPITLDEGEDDYPTPRASLDRDSASLAAKGFGPVGTSRAGNTQNGLQLDVGLDSTSLSHSASLSRSSTLRDNSTTDDEDKPPGSSSSNTSSGLMMAPKRPHLTADSYFPPQVGSASAGARRRSPLKASKLVKSSPLSGLPLDAASPSPLSPESWDYAETEWWGWIILVITWITFVVGMGSCLGFWSWAWDVGETPYAPPELEDDPTLPIVGYYPALIVLTGVMAWVWVITAWVGMKYFKHAKMSGDDG